MTILMRGRQVFRVAVKGGARCTDSPPGPEVQRAPETMPGPALFDQYAIRASILPMEIIYAAQQRHGCAAELMRTNAVGFVISEEAAIWQLGCERLAYQTSFVFVVVKFEAPGKNFRFLEFAPPRGRERTIASAILVDPDWNLPTRTVTSIARSRAQGDCGTFERHRVTKSGDFVLVEYREKKECDGTVGRPQDWPLLFRAN